MSRLSDAKVRRYFRLFVDGAELLDITSFNISFRNDAGAVPVQVSRNDPKMKGARLREDYILDHLETGEADKENLLVVHVHLIANSQPLIGFDPHRLLRTDFKRGKST
jgi:hypothetical protein